MLLSDIAGEYGLTKLAALDACALGGLRIRSFHAELTDSQVERLRWVLGPTAPHSADAAGSPEAAASSLLSRWDNAMQGRVTAASGGTTTVIAPPAPPPDEAPRAEARPPADHPDELEPGLHPDFAADFDDWEELDDDEALDPAHLAALALVEAEEETIDAAALAAELRRLAREPEQIGHEPPPPPPPAPPAFAEVVEELIEPITEAEPPPTAETTSAVEPTLDAEATSGEEFPSAEGLRPVDEPAAPATRDLPRHPFKPLSFEDVVADLGVQLQEEDDQARAAPTPAPAPAGPIASDNPPAAPLPPQPLAPAAPTPAPAADPMPEPAGRSHVAPPTGGLRPRDLDTGGDAADAGALAFLDHRNVIEATPIPEERLEKKVVGSLVMAVWVAILIGAVVLIVQLRGGNDDTASAVTEPIGDDTVGAVRDVFDLSQGDCFTTPGIGSVQTAVVVPCAEPHTAEVYATVDYPSEDGLFPGDETLRAFGDQACLEAFPGFIGVDYLVSGLDYYFVTPQESAWNDGGRRTVSCSVIEPGFRPVTGSLEGSAR